MFSVAVELFNRYVGTGMMIALVLVAIIYLLITEKNKTVKAVLCFIPLAALCFYFVPGLGNLLGKVVGNQSYVRFLWMIPNVIIIGYTCVKLIESVDKKYRILTGVLAASLIMISGSLIYLSDDYERATNTYHLPQSVVDICDEVIIPGREVRVAFPGDMVLYVRQYSPLVFMPYGRDAYTGVEGDELFDLINAEEFDFERFVRITEEKSVECHYIVLDKNKKVTGNIENVGYEFYKEIDGYFIYKNNRQDFGTN